MTKYWYLEIFRTSVGTGYTIVPCLLRSINRCCAVVTTMDGSLVRVIPREALFSTPEEAQGKALNKVWGEVQEVEYGRQ